MRGHVAKRRAENGLGITHADDGKALQNRWVLFWRKLRSGKASSAKPWFVQMSAVVVEGGFQWVGDHNPQLLLLASETRSPPPFDTGEQRFRSAFGKVLDYTKFKDLRADEASGELWYRPRKKMTQEFWKAVKEEYRRP